MASILLLPLLGSRRSQIDEISGKDHWDSLGDLVGEGLTRVETSLRGMLVNSWS